MPARTRRKSGDGAGKPAPSTMSHEEQLVHAREAALRLLSVRERSEQELRTRLKQKGYARPAVDQAIARLQEAGLQDDRRFAESFAEGAAARGLAGRRIQSSLLAKGLDREAAARAATTSPEEEEERARALAESRARKLGALAPDARARRIFGLLARRGYSPDICSRLAAEAAGADPSDGSEPTGG